MLLDELKTDQKYVTLFRLAFKSEARRKGGHIIIIRNLINANRGKIPYGLPCFMDQLAAVKGYMYTLIDVFSKWDITPHERKAFKRYRDQLEQCVNMDMLEHIIDELITATAAYDKKKPGGDPGFNFCER